MNNIITLTPCTKLVSDSARKKKVLICNIYLLFSENPGLDGEELDDKESETKTSNVN